MSKKLKDQLTSGTATPGTSGTSPAPCLSEREYYDRYGYLPPGFSVKIDGKVIKGGCKKWEAHFKEMGHPENLPAWQYQRLLDKTYRPWMNGDAPLQWPAYGTPTKLSMQRPTEPTVTVEMNYRGQQPPLSKAEKVLQETVDAANEWLRKHKVDDLHESDPKRKKVFGAFVKWYQKQPKPDSYKNMAERDPNRLGAPPGWSQADGRKAYRAIPQTEVQAKHDAPVKPESPPNRRYSMHDLFMNLERMQSPFATDEELEKSVEYWLNLQKKQAGIVDEPEPETEQ